MRLPAHPARHLLAVIIGLAAVGCYPVTQLQGPRTVAPGELQGAVAAGAQWLGQRERFTALPLDVALRYGVTDRIDVSFRTRPSVTSLEDSTLELGGKFQLLREKELEFAIASSFVSAGIDRHGFDDEDTSPDEEASFTFGRLALIAGTNADDVGSLWIAPTIDLGERRYPVDGTTRYQPLVAVGSCAGVALRLGADVQLLVQGGFAVGVAGEAVAVQRGQSYDTALGPGDFIGEASLGLLIGGFRD